MDPFISPFPLVLGEATVECASLYYGLIGTDEATDETNIYRETTTIELVENQCFGVEFGLLTASRRETGIWLGLSYEVQYPDLAQPGAYRVVRHDFEYELNTYLFLWQKLDTADEMVPGRWTISVLYADQMLLAQAFDVVKEAD